MLKMSQVLRAYETHSGDYTGNFDLSLAAFAPIAFANNASDPLFRGQFLSSFGSYFSWHPGCSVARTAKRPVDDVE